MYNQGPLGDLESQFQQVMQGTSPTPYSPPQYSPVRATLEGAAIGYGSYLLSGVPQLM